VTINGIDRDALLKIIDTLREHPDLANFQFRANQEWIDGVHARTTIQDFFGVGEEQTSRKQPHRLDADEPELLLGHDQGPGATEALLHALVSCMGGTFVYYATALGVKIDSMRLHAEGDVDLRGFLGIAEEVRRGFQNIRVTFDVASGAPREKIDELIQLTQKYSPVFDVVSHGVPVSVRLREREQKVAPSVEPTVSP
jgi:uncharacterized OsmC-like protein